MGALSLYIAYDFVPVWFNTNCYNIQHKNWGRTILK